MRQKKWKFGKQFGVFKSNRLERALSNKRLPNGKKSEMKIYQNAQTCYERGDMKEDSVRRLPWSQKTSMKSEDFPRSLLAHHILKDFQKDFQKYFPKVFQSLILIWKICISKNVQMASKRENEWKIWYIYLYRTHKNRYPKFIDLHLKEWKMRTMW